MSNMLNHDYSGAEIDRALNTHLPVLSGDILLHNGFRYVLKWANMDDWKWEDDIKYKWTPFGENAHDAPAMEFQYDGLIPIRYVNSDGNILWEIDDEQE